MCKQNAEHKTIVHWQYSGFWSRLHSGCSTCSDMMNRQCFFFFISNLMLSATDKSVCCWCFFFFVLLLMFVSYLTVPMIFFVQNFRGFSETGGIHTPPRARTQSPHYTIWINNTVFAAFWTTSYNCFIDIYAKSCGLREELPAMNACITSMN